GLHMLITTMPDLSNLTPTNPLTLTRCSTNSRPIASQNLDSDDSNSPNGLETHPFVAIKKPVEPKSLDDLLTDWVAKNDELGVPKSKSFLPFLVGSPKLADCLVCENVIYPGEEIPCVVRDCKGSYHLTCARDWLGFSQSSKAFKCPQHACFLCKKSFHLWRCSRCHLASHDKCAAYPEYVLHSSDRPSQKICWRHATDWPPLKPAVPTNSIEEFFCRLPLPYMAKEFNIDLTLKAPVENNRPEAENNGPEPENNRLEPAPYTKHCGWGVEAAESIKKGEFIIEYVGEVISDALCEQRLWDMKDVDGETRVGVFAARSIKAGEPLTYDYRFVQFGPEVKCQCGASCCQGYLGSKKKTPKLGLLDWGAKRRRTATASLRIIRQ
ncbi:hypothetical protein M8C21_008825, partial [Ambrosia artemisiifolia]